MLNIKCDGWYIDDAPQKKDLCYKKTVSFLKQYEKTNSSKELRDQRPHLVVCSDHIENLE